MSSQFRIASLFVVASALPLSGCDQSSSLRAPTDPARIVTTNEVANRANGNGVDRTSPQERAVHAAMDEFKQAIIDINV